MFKSNFAGGLAGGEVTSVPHAEVRQAETRTVAIVPHDDTVQAAVGLACHVKIEKPTATWLIRNLLEDRLNEQLRNALGATYGVHAVEWPEAHGATLEVHTRVPPSRAGEAVKALTDGIGALAREEVTGPALDALKLRVARQSVTWWQTSGEVFDLLRSAVLAGADPREHDLAKQLIDVGPADLAAELAPCAGFEAITVAGPEAPIRKALADVGIEDVGTVP